MLFTLELESITITLFRLQKDGFWRKIDQDIKMQANDFTSTNPSEITARSTSKKTMELEGTIYDIDPHEWPTAHEQLHHGSRIFRKEYPTEPTLEQLRKTIAAGNDFVNNCLILNVYGKFELRQSPPFNQLLNDPSIVVRHETFIAGNGYVGEKASKHEEFINDNYISSLEFWRDHLKDHTTQEYSDLHSTSELTAIQAELAEIRRNWKPDY